VRRCGYLQPGSSIRTIRSSGPFEHRPELHHGPQLAVRVADRPWEALGQQLVASRGLGARWLAAQRHLLPAVRPPLQRVCGWKPRKLCYARRSNRQGRRKSWKPIELHHRILTVPASTGGVFNAPGTSGRNILRGPGSSNMDFAIFKIFSFTETIKAQVRAQAYNLTNTPHFANRTGI